MNVFVYADVNLPQRARQGGAMTGRRARHAVNQRNPAARVIRSNTTLPRVPPAGEERENEWVMDRASTALRTGCPFEARRTGQADIGVMAQKRGLVSRIRRDNAGGTESFPAPRRCRRASREARTLRGAAS